jgi:hypothetical protein
MTKTLLWVGVLILGVLGSAQAQLVVMGDRYGVPFGASLVVEAPGVLENDTFDGEPAEDAGGVVELLSSVSYGTLTCEADPFLDLCPDGSFTYTPDTGFAGLDIFTYQTVLGSVVAQAAVTLSACSGGPTVFTCWKEASYLAKLGELGYSNVQEGFEDDMAWGLARQPFAAPSVSSNGTQWETNHPAPPHGNHLTTGTGPARTGLWGVYDPEHGYATGTPTQCDIDVPPPECLFKDGFTGTREPGYPTLYAAGGHFTGSAQPNLVMILDGGAPIKLGRLFIGAHQFFGVIDSAGFTSFRVEETNGKIGQARFVFGDDFILGTSPADTTPPQVVLVNSVADTGDGQLADLEMTAVPISELLLTFSEPLLDPADLAVDSVTNTANYLLFSDGGDGFQTVNCATGVDANDMALPVDLITYVSGSELTASLEINGGLPLPPGHYRLLACGTTSIRDGAGNALDGDGNGIGGDDYSRNFAITGDAAPGHVPSTLRTEMSSITPGNLILSWSPSCSSGGVDYAIYEGTLGDYGSHTMIDCTDDSGDLTEEIVPQTANSYYLVVPIGATAEGSYGLASNGAERSVPRSAAGRCRVYQMLGGCN